MPWVYKVEGSEMAKGPALVTPLALDLAMVVNTFNGLWDRDNLGENANSSSSTIESPFVSAIGYLATAALGADFILQADGRKDLVNVDQTFTTLDSMVVLTAMSSVRLRITTNPAAGSFRPVSVALGVELDGRVVYMSGYEVVKVYSNNLAVDLSLARFQTAVPVAAGSHRIRLFYDFIHGPATDNAGTAAPLMEVPLDGCRQLETFLMYEEVRR